MQAGDGGDQSPWPQNGPSAPQAVSVWGQLHATVHVPASTPVPTQNPSDPNTYPPSREAAAGWTRGQDYPRPRALRSAAQPHPLPLCRPSWLGRLWDCSLSPASFIPTTGPGPAPGHLHTEHTSRGCPAAPGREFLSPAITAAWWSHAPGPRPSSLSPLLHSNSKRFTVSVTTGLPVYSITCSHITQDVILYNFTGNQPRNKPMFKKICIYRYRLTCILFSKYLRNSQPLFFLFVTVSNQTRQEFRINLKESIHGNTEYKLLK